MKKAPRPGPWLMLSAIVALVGAGGMYMQMGSVNEKTREYDKLKSLVRRPYQIEQKLAETQKDVDEAKQRLEHLEKAVPAFAYVPTLLKELEEFGKQHGLDVFGVRPMPKQENPKDKTKKKKKDPYVELLIEVKGRGTYAAIASFVRDLQKFPKIVAAHAVSLEPKNDVNMASGMLDMTVELQTYLIRPSKDELQALVDDLRKKADGVPEGGDRQITSQPPSGATASPGGKTNGQ